MERKVSKMDPERRKHIQECCDEIRAWANEDAMVAGERLLEASDIRPPASVVDAYNCVRSHLDEEGVFDSELDALPIESLVGPMALHFVNRVDYLLTLVKDK